MKAGRTQIGEVAERTGLSLRTVRYYEEVGLVEPSDRTPGGFRLYTDGDVALLRLVKRMKALEFSLEDTRELLKVVTGLAAGPPEPERRRLVEQMTAWRQEIDSRCAVLRQRLQVAEGLATRLNQAVSAPSPGWIGGGLTKDERVGEVRAQ